MTESPQSTGARTRRILGIAAPIVGGMVSQNILNLVDTAMVGSLGKEALAGVGIGGFASFMAVSALTGLSAAVQAVSARRVGEGRESEAASSLHSGIVMALVVGAVLSLLLVTTVPYWFGYLVDDPAVIAEGVPYLRARLMVSAFVGINFAFRGFWNGVDRSTLYFRTLVFMHVSNVAISYALIFGAFGMPELGTMGAGIGTAVSGVLGTGSYVVLGLLHGRQFGFLQAPPKAADFRNLARLALPSAIQQFLFAAGYTVFFTILGGIGTAEVAAGQVLINLTLVMILPGLGLGLAAATLVGQALGRGEPDDAKRWGWDVVRVACVVMMLLGVPMLLAPSQILGVFLPTEPAVVALAVPALMVIGGTIVIDAFGMVLLNALMGAGAVRTVVSVSVPLQWLVGLPLAYLVGPVLGFGLFEVWLTQILQRLLQAIAFSWIWSRGAWADTKV
jgi:putative MATE family efflux protein